MKPRLLAIVVTPLARNNLGAGQHKPGLGALRVSSVCTLTLARGALAYSPLLQGMRSTKQNAPDSILSRGTYVDQPSPENCSTTTLRPDLH